MTKSHESLSTILFYLRKFIGMWLMPIPLTLLMMALALLLIKRRPRTAQAILLLAVLFLGLTSWEPVASRLIATIETPFVVFDSKQPVDRTTRQ